MLSFQLGGILIVPDRKLADHIKSERKRERGGERVCVYFYGIYVSPFWGWEGNDLISATDKHILVVTDSQVETFYEVFEHCSRLLTDKEDSTLKLSLAESSATGF